VSEKKEVLAELGGLTFLVLFFFFFSFFFFLLILSK